MLKALAQCASSSAPSFDSCNFKHNISSLPDGEIVVKPDASTQSDSLLECMSPNISLPGNIDGPGLQNMSLYLRNGAWLHTMEMLSSLPVCFALSLSLLPIWFILTKRLDRQLVLFSQFVFYPSSSGVFAMLWFMLWCLTNHAFRCCWLPSLWSGTLLIVAPIAGEISKPDVPLTLCIQLDEFVVSPLASNMAGGSKAVLDASSQWPGQLSNLDGMFTQAVCMFDFITVPVISWDNGRYMRRCAVWGLLDWDSWSLLCS